MSYDVILRLLRLEGYRTYLAAAGLLGLAVYQVTHGEIEPGIQSMLAALAAFGLRAALEPQPAKS